MPPSETLIKAKAYIANPDNWTREAYARGSNGMACLVTSPRATCYCAIGALRKLKNGSCSSPQEEKLLQDASYSLYQMSVFAVNDTMTHEDVMHVYDKAIEAARGWEKTSP